MLLSKYICIRIKRNPHIVFIFIAIVISFVWLVNEMGTIGVAQAAKLENMYNDFNVRCVLSKPNGSRDNLLISNTYISYFTDPSYGLSQHLKDICFKRTLYYELPVYSHNIGNNELHNIGNNELLIMQLVGISRLEAEPIISDENGISIDFINGYTEEALQNDSLICVVNEWLLFNLGLQPGNNIKISAIDRQDNFNNVVEFIDTEMLIIGSVKGGYVYTIYCPWETAVSLAEMSSGIPPITELMGAVIIDNKHINEFKEIASKYFTYVEAMAQSSTHGFALTVYDSILIQSSLKV